MNEWEDTDSSLRSDNFLPQITLINTDDIGRTVFIRCRRRYSLFMNTAFKQKVYVGIGNDESGFFGGGNGNARLFVFNKYPF